VGSYCTSQFSVPLEAFSMLGNPFYHMWEFLPNAVREHSPRWQQAVGAKADQVFTALYEDPARLKPFIELTNANSAPQGLEMAERFDFSPYQCVLDVAGGSGGMVISIGTRVSAPPRHRSGPAPGVRLGDREHPEEPKTPNLDAGSNQASQMQLEISCRARLHGDLFE
jgi:hypothetical protein